MKKTILIFLLCLMIGISMDNSAFAQANTLKLPHIPLLSAGDDLSDRTAVADAIEILFFLTVLTLAPAIVLMTTSFTRMVIVLSFLRQAIGLQQIPANQVVIGLSLFMTVFLMRPIGTKIYTEAWSPYANEQISHKQALKVVDESMRSFMFTHTRKEDLKIFHSIASAGQAANTKADVDTFTLVPAFVISELKTAFQMAFLVYIPFLIIDLIIASVLMSIGLMLLPPVLVSLPFKILLFVSIDGWNLIVTSLLSSFQIQL